MEMCPPLLVDSVVDQIRPPYPRRAPGAHRDGTVEAPGVRLDHRGATGPPVATPDCVRPGRAGS
jgi:hypothetical protein